MTKIIDLDKQLGFADEPVHVRKVVLFGTEWTILCDVNTFALSNLTTGDPQAIVNFILGVIDPAQRNEFARAISAVPNLDVEKLSAIVGALVEVAAERPTSLPSASRPGAKSRTSAPKSRASTGATRVVRSTS